jgi:acyl-[acyl-carrier-protein]-phospholipid O-acyltransferase / long-chain-fatty-acid--[acyl-carrier-protein] ligase
MTSLSYANPLDFKKICAIVREEKATFMVGTPSFFWGYLRKSAKGDFDSLRIMLCGADRCPDSLREGFKKKHDTILYEAYGATETSPAISGNSPEHNKPGSVGLPFPDTKIRIVHHDTGEELPPHQDGKILVKSDSVMKGYLNDSKETSRQIKDGWYDTGDMGHLDEDGYLWHVGRLKRFVKIGGEMISLVNVETALNDFLPEGEECCVVGVPDKLKGAKIVAVITAPIDIDATLSNLADILPSIAIPKKFLIKDELPKMGNGKIDFRKITQMAEQELS